MATQLKNLQKKAFYRVVFSFPIGTTLSVNPEYITLTVQNVKFPERTVNTAAHGEKGVIKKTASTVEIGELEFEVLKENSAPTSGIAEALLGAVFTIPNNANADYIRNLPLAYFNNVSVFELNEAGVVRTHHLFRGAFPTKVTHNGLEATSADNATETITFAVNDYVVLPA